MTRPCFVAAFTLLALACGGDDKPAGDMNAAGQGGGQGGPVSPTSVLAGTGAGTGAVVTSGGTNAPMGGAAAGAIAGGTTGGVMAGAGGVMAGTTGGAAGTAGAAGTTGGSGAGTTATPTAVDITLAPVIGHESVGLDWTAVEGATGYRIYASSSPTVMPGDADAQVFESTEPAWVHRGLTDGVSTHYVVTAILPDGESTPSNVVEAIPTGEWVLEELGTGLFDDLLTGEDVPRVAVERRVHVLLMAEGYRAEDMAQLHDVAAHDGARGSDVDDFVDDLFALEPYSMFRGAFVIWYLPRVSNESIGGDTAFRIPVDLSGSFPGVGSFSNDMEVATRMFAAVAAHPFPPTEFYSGFSQRALNHVAYVLMFDPARGSASVSGRAGSVSDPASGQRINAAFGIPFTHEFTHAFASLTDEYIETTRMVTSTSATSNVGATNVCGELPWQHLLAGGAINPDVDELVGAFGVEGFGYRPELVCLMNGQHENAMYYGGNGSLRTDDRMCNFCREMTTFRIFERSGAIATDGAFDTWKASYRMPFYDRYGFQVPAVVPQTNDVRDPAAGMSFYEACVP